METMAEIDFQMSLKSWGVTFGCIVITPIILFLGLNSGLYNTPILLLLNTVVVIAIVYFLVKYFNTTIRQLNASLIEKDKQLKAINEEFEAFSYSVSHDLRAPLRAINGFSNMLEDNYKDKLDEDAIRLLDVIRENSLNMGQLIDGLLSFSRTGRKAMSIEQIDMDAVVNSALNSIVEQNPGIKNKIKVKELPYAYGDRQMMQQVYSHLLSNAVKFTSKKANPEIEVGFSGDENSTLTFYVKDNGAGFDTRYANSLFGVFQRLHGQKDFQGNGVGLALCKRIINRHGGDIWADAEVDKGATFYFTLPNKA